MFTSDLYPQKYDRVVFSPDIDITRQIPQVPGQIIRPLDLGDKIISGPIQLKPFEAVSTAENVSLFIDPQTSNDVWTIAGIATALQRPWNIIAQNDVELPEFTDGIATARFNSYRDISRITSSNFERIKPREDTMKSDLLPLPEHRIRILPGQDDVDFTVAVVEACRSLGVNVLPPLPGDPDEAYQALEITNAISLTNLFMLLDYEMPMVIHVGKESSAINHFILGFMMAAPMQTHYLLTKQIPGQHMTYAAGLGYINYTSYNILEAQLEKHIRENSGFLAAVLGK